MSAVTLLREAVTAANGQLVTAVGLENDQNNLITSNKVVIKAKAAALAAAKTKCYGLKFDQYRTDVALKESARKTSLKAIESLLDGVTPIAHGATGGRCEKPQSNGDNLRRGKCTLETDCCGAATGKPHGDNGPLVTIEVCQAETDSTYMWVGPRAPMAEKFPDPKSWPFVCITGATKLAGVASAVLASAYLMA